MTTNKIIRTLVTALAFVLLGYILYFTIFVRVASSEVKNTSATTATLTGTFECLEYTKSVDPTSPECIFGFKTDDDAYYVVDFGKEGSSFSQFKRGVHVKVEGSIVDREASRADQLTKQNIRGMFTLVKTLESDDVAK